MKRNSKVDIYGKIENVRILRSKSAKRAKLCVSTEDLQEDTMLPVTIWGSNANNIIELLAIGTTVHIVGKVRVQNQTTAFHVERTFRDIVASKVEIM